ncbi:MAG: hypothetical protein EOO91_15150 [Pedobacter sp.]|nr:MAG: hypothetical protein EOO91_15150 [Pedobacter sp.]
MKYSKYCIALILLLISIFIAKAQTTGRGCFVNNKIYTQYLGLRLNGVRCYNSAGAFYNINYNNYSATKPNNYNYTCGEVNEFNNSGNGPNQNEFVETNGNTPCIISTSTVAGVNGNGTDGTYTVNNPTYCSVASLPLDDYTWVLVLVVGGFVGYLISSRKIVV